MGYYKSNFLKRFLLGVERRTLNARWHLEVQLMWRRGREVRGLRGSTQSATFAFSTVICVLINKIEYEGEKKANASTPPSRCTPMP